MTNTSSNNGISVRATPGTRSVFLGMNATAKARKGLLGFAIGRRLRKSESIQWLRGFKFFEETEPTPEPGERRSTLEHPLQTFLWGDYRAEPNQNIHYTIRPVYGEPTALTYGDDVELSIKTYDEDAGPHALYFNRGAIPSQAFADRFGNKGPTKAEISDPNNEKVQWLSRGLLEGLLRFIEQASSSQFELRICAYEFNYPPVLEALRAAAERGATVRICFDAGDGRRDGTVKQTSTSKANRLALRASGLDKTDKVSLHERTFYSGITHNKFMILMRRSKPAAVWTGSTNITPSGFLGQNNVGHLVRDTHIAAEFNHYWEAISKDPDTRSFKNAIMAMSPTPPSGPPKNGTTTIFSPRKAGMLEWYADRLGKARSSVMLTAAFGVDDLLAEKFAIDKDFLRFILMEKRDSNAMEQAMLRSDRDTLISMGAGLNTAAIRHKMAGHRLDEWFKKEQHFRNKGHIFYVHTKYMLIDALSNDPIIFTGSANFSDGSVGSNDENMLLIRGPDSRRVADIYVNEFTRMFNHLYFRTIAVKRAQQKTMRRPGRPVAMLDPTDRWLARYFKTGTPSCRRRLLFS